MMKLSKATNWNVAENPPEDGGSSVPVHGISKTHRITPLFIGSLKEARSSFKNKRLQRMKETPRTEGANTSTRTAICVMQMRLEIKRSRTGDKMIRSHLTTEK